MAKLQLTEEHKMRMRDHMVEGLRESVKRGLSRVPESVLDVIETEAWKKRYVEKLGRETGFDTFKAFVEAEPLDGLGSSLDQLNRVCRGTPAEIKIDELTVGEQGGSNNRWGRGGKPEEENVSRGINRNIVTVDSLEDHLRQLEEEDKRRQESEGPVRGNSRQFALRKLRKEAAKEAERGDEPKIALLYEQVKQKQLSPHKAMVEAGFRKKTVSVPLEPRAIARTLRRHLTEDQLEDLISELAGDL